LGFAPKAALCLTRSAAFLLLETAQDKPGSAQLKPRKRRGNRVGMPEDKGRDINAPCEPIKTRAHCNDGTDAAGGGAK